MASKSPHPRDTTAVDARSQKVVVQSDEVMALIRVAEAKSKSQPGEIDWQGLILQNKKLLAFGLAIPNVTLPLILKKIWDERARARLSGQGVVQISQSEALAFQFPPGHPRQQTLYIANPADHQIYYPAAFFHHMALQHKASEAIELLLNLGATHIHVEHVRGLKVDFSANAAAGLVEAKVNGSKSSNSSVIFDGTFKNTIKPRVPKGLFWYKHERTWKTLANGRLKHGMQKFSLDLDYDDDFGVNAGLKGSAESAGFEMGGSFQDHEATLWKIRGSFDAPCD